MNIRNLRFSTRAFLSFATILLLVTGLGIFSMAQTSRMREAIIHTEEVSHAGTRAIARIRDNSLSIRVITLRMMLNRDPVALNPSVERMNFLRGELNKAMAEYRPIVPPEAADTFSKMDSVVSSYNDKLTQYLAFSQQNDSVAMLQLLNGEIQDLSTQTGDLFNALVKINTEQAALYTRATKVLYGNAMQTTVGVQTKYPICNVLWPPCRTA